ncbi:hypothetical protein ACEQPO_29070 [Bacillus sp. SL00103]
MLFRSGFKNHSAAYEQALNSFHHEVIVLDDDPAEFKPYMASCLHRLVRRKHRSRFS